MRSRLSPMVVLLLLIAIGVIAVSAWLLLKRDRQISIFEVPATYIETVDTSRFSVLPFQISRFAKEDSVMVRFPKDALKYGLFLYDSVQYHRMMSGEHNISPMTQNDLEAQLLGRPQLNLSRLPDGTYYAHLTQCNFQGYFALHLTTLPPVVVK